jgi:predicted phosphodiesterase
VPRDTQWLVALGDVHANARAFGAALKQARRRPYDRLVILGDLLTYGPDVAQVLDLMADAQRRDQAELLIGNHDQLYFDLALGDSSYYETLPPWVRETVDWTLQRVDPSAMHSRFEWLDELAVGRWLFAHANPFGHGDWRYLSSTEDCCSAAAHLKDRGFAGGVFGHVHRPRLALTSTDGATVERESARRLSIALDRFDAGTVVAVAGSVGQPRGMGPAASLLRLRVTSTAIDLEVEPVPYDVNAHIGDLNAMGVSDETRRKLLSFFSGYDSHER